MIVDCHAHIYDKWSELEGISTREFVEIMDECQIDKACVFTLEGFFEPDGANDVLYERCRDFPDRLTPFCTVSPHQGSKAIIEMRRAVEKFGMKGLKVHPWLQAFSLTHPTFLNIVEETIQLDIPIIFHCGTPPYTCPSQVANLADKFPEAKLILGENGLKDLWQEALYCAIKYDNIYICFGAAPFESCREIVKHIPVSRILFGSDLGFSRKEEVLLEIEKIYALNLPPESTARIMGENMTHLVSF